MNSTGKSSSVLRDELALWIGSGVVLLMWTVGRPWVESPSNPAVLWGLFAGVFFTMLWLSFRVVHHAECLAERVGEPFGTIILTLSVITIEVVMISALMLQGKEAPTLARDTMFSVLMIVLNGMLGFTLLLGGLKHHQQVFNLEGARGFLGVLGCLAILCLVLPSFTTSSPGSSASPLLAGFLICTSVVLYGVFLFLQSTTHREFYQQPGEGVGHVAHGGHATRSSGYHAVFLVLMLLPIVLLSKKIAALLEGGLQSLGAPTALAGFVVALLVLAPEGLAACKAAWSNTLQRTVNILLGSALATIGLTVPAILGIGFATGKYIELGLPPTEIVLLTATLFVGMLVFSGNRTNVLAGFVHLVLFGAYLVLIFD